MFRTLTLAAIATAVTTSAFAGGISGAQHTVNHLFEGNGSDRALAQFITTGSDAVVSTKGSSVNPAVIQHLLEGDGADRRLAAHLQGK